LTGVLFDQRPSRVIRVEEDLVDQFFNFSEKRLARVLLLFGKMIKESKPEHPLKEEGLRQLQRWLANKQRTHQRFFAKSAYVRYQEGIDPKLVPNLTAFCTGSL
jgi:CRP/FNR family cyclic AMP-dependent transcriptional regulator